MVRAEPVPGQSWALNTEQGGVAVFVLSHPFYSLPLLPIAMGMGALTGTCLPPARPLGNVGHPGWVLSLSISASGQYPGTSHFCSTGLSP